MVRLAGVLLGLQNQGDRCSDLESRLKISAFPCGAASFRFDEKETMTKSELPIFAEQTFQQSKHAKEFSLLVERSATARQKNANLRHKAAGLRAPVSS